MRTAWLLSLLVCTALPQGKPALSADAVRTFEQLETLLKRLGETIAAGTLNTHRSEGRLVFGPLTVDTTAEVGAPYGNWGVAETNILTVNQRYENYGRFAVPPRPWNPKWDWVGLASTVIHELRHMTQYMPSRVPAHEDPAWRDQEAALGRWIEKLANEADQALAMPPGGPRKAALLEIADLARGLIEAAVTLEDARKYYEKIGRLTPRKAWRFESLKAQSVRLVSRIKADDPSATPDFASPALVVPPTGAWILSRTVVWSANSGIQDGTLLTQYTNGPAKASGMIVPELSQHRWEHPHKEGNPITTLSITWTRPPDMIRPATDVILKAKASDLGSTKGAGIEGDFVSFDPSLHASDDGTSFRFLWQGRPALYANPGGFEEREFRLPIPAAKTALLHLNIGTGNIFWGKIVTYEYKWKEGFRSPAKTKVNPVAKKKPVPTPAKKKGGG